TTGSSGKLKSPPSPTLGFAATSAGIPNSSSIATHLCQCFIIRYLLAISLPTPFRGFLSIYFWQGRNYASLAVAMGKSTRQSETSTRQGFKPLAHS
ncbi:MAG: hypothetical protein WBF52_02935, partial [Geitlerinemataceae cyanobacterium]